MSLLKDRPQQLADQLVQHDGAKFLASGKPQKFGSSAVEYEALLVRSRDKSRLLRLLSVSEETAADVALLVDVVLQQGAILAEHELQMDRLRAEIEGLRRERVATDVTKQVNDALLGAGRQGVGIEGFEFEIATEESATEDTEATFARGSAAALEDSRSSSGSAEIGAVLDYLKGAHLAGEGARETVEKVRSRLAARTRSERSSSRKVSGSLKVERVIPPALKGG